MLGNSSCVGYTMLILDSNHNTPRGVVHLALLQSSRQCNALEPRVGVSLVLLHGLGSLMCHRMRMPSLSTRVHTLSCCLLQLTNPYPSKTNRACVMVVWVVC